MMNDVVVVVVVVTKLGCVFPAFFGHRFMRGDCCCCCCCGFIVEFAKSGERYFVPNQQQIKRITLAPRNCDAIHRERL